MGKKGRTAYQKFLPKVLDIDNRAGLVNGNLLNMASVQLSIGVGHQLHAAFGAHLQMINISQVTGAFYFEIIIKTGDSRHSIQVWSSFRLEALKPVTLINSP